MAATETLTIVTALTLATIVVTAHSVIFSAASTWWSNQALLWHTDPDLARVRKRSEPWYVRYTRRTFRRG